MYYIVGSGGHDINTPGKRTHKFDDGSFMKEFEHNRVVFDELMRLLKLDYRFSVLDTAPGSNYISLNKRTSIANKFKKDNNIPRNKILYVSVHANADSSKSWSSSKGCETLYYPGSIEGERFAKAIGNEIAKALDVPNRGIKPRKDLAITRLTKMPAVVTEAAFMTNKQEAIKLMDHELRLKEAYAIYLGICKGFNLSSIIKDERKKNVDLIYEPTQDVDIVISTNVPLTFDQVIEILKGNTTVKQYTITEKQELLNAAGYYCGVPDGSKGPMTKKAIRAFQRLNKLEETEILDHECMLVLESIIKEKKAYRTLWFNDSEVHIYTGSLDDHEVGVGLGTYGKLEKLSEMASEYTCAVNGQFFGGGREGLGTLIRKGLYYFKPMNDKFANWIQYKSKKSEIRDVMDSELYKLQMSTEFTIGTSWPLMIKGVLCKILKSGITHKFFRHPRTLMADTSDKLFSFIVIDGRRKNSKGMTAKQCQELLKFIEKVLGIKFNNATNLDGGGSTEMMIDGVIVNVPSDGKERAIGTFCYLNRKE